MPTTAATGVTEYKAVGRSLGEHGVVDAQTVDLLVKLAGYRNRMVHFYHEEAQSLRDTEDHGNGASGSARWAPFSDQVTAAELFGICASELQDVANPRGVRAVDAPASRTGQR